MDVKATSLDFAPMHERMDFYVKQNILSCCATVVMQGQEICDYKTFGYMDLESKRRYVVMRSIECTQAPSL